MKKFFIGVLTLMFAFVFVLPASAASCVIKNNKNGRGKIVCTAKDVTKISFDIKSTSTVTSTNSVSVNTGGNFIYSQNGDVKNATITTGSASSTITSSVSSGNVSVSL